jgi:aminopeptidase N
MTQQPQAKYRHDYRAPDYLISDIDLTFDLDAAKTVVTALSKVSVIARLHVPLRLDGEDLTLVSMHVNDQPWTQYKEEDNQLVIDGLPEHHPAYRE